MGKGSTQILIRKIMNSLAKCPKSATEIADETGLDRTSIIRYLNVLKQSEFVVEEKKGVSKKFILSSKYRLDTYFGLPLTLEINKLVDSLYFLIQKTWKEKTGRKLLKTTAQKIIYQVIQTCKLNIPTGWYIYGGICIKPYDYNEVYDFKGLKDNVTLCVNETVAEYSVNHFEYESKQLQYKKAEKELYDLKEDILKLLYSSNFSKNSMYTFQKLFNKFWRLIPKGDKIYDDLINDYDTLLIDVTKHWDEFIDEKNERNFAEFKQKFISSFEAVWKMIAMYNFKADLSSFYLDKQLEEHFKFDISQAKEELIEIGSEINEMIPFEEPNDPVYRQLKEIRKKASKILPRTVEEQAKIQKEMDKYKEKYGIEALGKKLRKDFGL